MTTNQNQKSSFSLSSHPHLDEDLNQLLLDCFDIDELTYTSEQDIVDVIKDKNVCSYQSKVLKACIREPENYLDIEIDKLTATLNCSKSNIARLLGKSGKSITKIKRESKLCDLATIRQVPVWAINRGHNTKERPFYSKAFEVKWIGDHRKKFLIQISEANHKTNVNGLRFDFIPARFEPQEVQLIMEHLASKLFEDQYFQILKKARVTRLDQAMNLYGLFRPIIYFAPPYTGLIEEKGDVAPHTTYFNQKETSNHYIQYDKLLKELRLNPLLVRHFDDLVAITRLEYRHARNRDKDLKDRKINISLLDFNDIPPALPQMELIDPAHFYRLPRATIRRLLAFKDKRSYQQVIEELHQLLSKQSRRFRIYSIDDKWYQETLKSRLGQLSRSFLLEHDTANYPFSPQQAEPETPPDFSRITTQQEELDRQQLRVIRSPASRIYVNAGPGSGKTHCLVERAKHLVDRGAAPETIQIVTFTNKAAKVIRDRLAKKDDDIDYSGIRVSTLSRLAKEATEASQKRKIVIDETKTLKILRKCSRLIRSKHLRKLKVEDVQNVVAYYYHNGDMHKAIEARTKLDPNQTVEQFFAIVKEYEVQKRKAYKTKRLVDFEDLLRGAKWAFTQERPNDAIDPIKHLLIDETQDLSPLEWKLVYRIVKRQDCGLMLVGDMAQSIFDFKGGHASPSIRRKFKGLKRYSIDVNRRSSAPIINLANTVLGEFSASLPQQALVHGKGSLLPELIEASKFGNAVDTVVRDIKKLRNKKIRMKDIAIVVSTNQEAEEIYKELRTKQVGAFLQQKNNDGVSISEPTDKQVTISNVHNVKGREFQHVYFFDPRLRNVKRRNIKTTELALVYVAISRAITYLTVIKSVCGKQYYFDATQSDTYILDTLDNVPVSYRFI
jgi:superfamily I DNA/RNA helicase